jgi:hypothetical protein
MNSEMNGLFSDVFYHVLAPMLFFVLVIVPVIAGLYFLGRRIMMGKIRKVINVKIVSNRKDFSDSLSSEEMIVTWGLALNEAKETLGDKWGITTKGYLRRLGRMDTRSLPYLETTLVIDHYVDHLSHVAILRLRGMVDNRDNASIAFCLDHSDLDEGHNIIFSKRMKLPMLVK